MALRIVRKSVGLRPRTFGGGRSAEISSNSASDISVEYRSRMTSYFARSASFQGIANLPKLLQTRENQTPRGRSTNFRSGSEIVGVERLELRVAAARHVRHRLREVFCACAAARPMLANDDLEAESVGDSPLDEIELGFGVRRETVDGDHDG